MGRTKENKDAGRYQLLVFYSFDSRCQEKAKYSRGFGLPVGDPLLPRNSVQDEMASADEGCQSAAEISNPDQWVPANINYP